MIGYTLHPNNYCLYNEKTKKGFQSRDVIFYETNPHNNINLNHFYNYDSDTETIDVNDDQIIQGNN